MFTFDIPRRVTQVVLAAAVIAGAGACQARVGATGAGAPSTTGPVGAEAAAREIPNPAVEALIADARAARTQHDARALHLIRMRLTGVIGDAAARQAETTYRRVLADLAAADAAHDAMARARSRARLNELCDPAGVRYALGWCDAYLAGPAD
jgi:hypothetical protein